MGSWTQVDWVASCDRSPSADSLGHSLILPQAWGWTCHRGAAPLPRVGAITPSECSAAAAATSPAR